MQTLQMAESLYCPLGSTVETHTLLLQFSTRQSVLYVMKLSH